MIHGTATALKIGVISVFFAFIVGVGLGMMSAYYKDDGIGFSIPQLFVMILFMVIGLYYLIMEWLIFNTSILYFSSGLLVLFAVVRQCVLWLDKWQNSKKYHIPLDMLLIKIIEVRKSFPGIFILLALVSLFFVPSIWNFFFAHD